MQQCHACGATLGPAAGWCGQCFARPSAVTTVPARFTTLAVRPGAVVQRSRWRKTQTTFGPVGRVLATLGLVLPFVVLVALGVIGDIFALGGAALWGFVLMPWGLRDVWKAGQLPTRTAQ